MKRSCINPACNTMFEPDWSGHVWCNRFCRLSDFEAWRLTQEDYIDPDALGGLEISIFGDRQVIKRFNSAALRRTRPRAILRVRQAQGD